MTGKVKSKRMELLKMTVKEMKRVLADKLKAENTYFTMSDISIRKHGDSYKIVIKDYEHIPFKMSFEHDDYFGYCVYIKELFDNHLLIFVDDAFEYDIHHALIRLGYYIGNTF